MAQDKKTRRRRGRPSAPRRGLSTRARKDRERKSCCNRSAPSSARRTRAASTASPRRGTDLTFGQFGLKAMEPERVTARQIEAARRAITRHMKRAGRVWIRVFPDVPVSKKPIEVRMGKGKGAPEFWVGAHQAGPHPVRDRRRAGRSSPRKRCARRRQAADQDALRRAHRRVRERDDESRRCAGDDRRPARRRGPQAEEGAVQPALPAGDRPAREHRRACAWCAATSRGSRPSLRRSDAGTAAEDEDEVGMRSQDAEAHAAGRRGQRQAGQDGRRARRAPLHASGDEEDGAAVEEVSRA